MKRFFNVGSISTTFFQEISGGFLFCVSSTVAAPSSFPTSSCLSSPACPFFFWRWQTNNNKNHVNLLNKQTTTYPKTSLLACLSFFWRWQYKKEQINTNAKWLNKQKFNISEHRYDRKSSINTMCTSLPLSLLRKKKILKNQKSSSWSTWPQIVVQVEWITPPEEIFLQ